MATGARGGGFWRGFLLGVVIVAAALLALALAVPPKPLQPPDVAPGSLVAPAGPERLAMGISGPPPAATSDLIVPASLPGPLIEGLPGPTAAPPTPAAGASLVPLGGG